MITIDAYRAAVGNWYLRRGVSSSKSRINHSEPLNNQSFFSQTNQQVLKTYTTAIVLLTALLLLPILWTSLTMKMLAKKRQQKGVPDTETTDNVCLTALVILYIVWTPLIMMMITMKQNKDDPRIHPYMETRARGLNDTSVWHDKTGKIHIPPLKGGARVSEDDMSAKAIRSAWRHGINLKRGRENPAAGNCSIEVRLFCKSIR